MLKSHIIRPSIFMFLLRSIKISIFTVLLCGCSPRLPSQTSVTPDFKVRLTAQKIKENDVSFLRLRGGDFGCLDENSFIDIKDTALTKEFLTALRTADYPKELGADRDDTIEIHLKKKVNRKKIVTFEFFAPSVSDSYGPKFRDALDNLSIYQATQTRKLIHDQQSNIKSVCVNNLTMSNTEQLSHIIFYLGQVSHRHFDYTNSLSYQPLLNLNLKSGHSIQLRLVVDPSWKSDFIRNCILIPSTRRLKHSSNLNLL